MNKNVLSIIIILVVFAAAFIGIYIYFEKNAPNPDGNFENTDTEADTDIQNTNSEIFASLSDFKEYRITEPEVSKENVKKLLEIAKIPDSFSWNYTSTIYSSRGNKQSVCECKHSNGAYKIEIYNTRSVLEREITITDESTSVVNYDAAGNSSKAVYPSADTSIYAEAGIPDISEFIGNEGDFTFSLAESEYGTLLTAQFRSDKDSYTQTQEYYFSLDYGIVIKADCYENGNLIYTLTTEKLYKL